MCAAPAHRISIHALREEGDLRVRISRHPLKTFLSTPSARRATAANQRVAAAYPNFYPRPPRGGRPPRYRPRSSTAGFLSTPSARRATPAFRTRLPQHPFLSTPSARRATAKAEKKSSTFVLLYIFLHKLKRAFGKNADGTAPLLIDSFTFSVRRVPGNTVCLWFAQCRNQKINTLSCAKFGCRPTCSTLVW